MSDRIVVLDGHTTNPGDLDWAPLRALGSLEVFARTAPSEVAERAAGAPCVLMNKTIISSEAIAALPALRYVGVLATGYNTVDLAAARGRAITVTNIPTYATQSVAEHAAAMMLDLARGLSANAAAVRAGGWGASPDWCFATGRVIELSGRTLGLVGIGRIGVAFAQIAAALGMRLIAFDPAFPPAEQLDGLRIQPTGLDELFVAADVVSLHCPLTEATRHVVNRAHLARMRPGAFLINTSRGPLIDEAALAEALTSGPLAAAALDVLETEPPPPDHPLIAAPNCLVTGHVAWQAVEARRRLIEAAAENLAAFQRGTPINVVR